jgi:hypothetical protein
MTYPRTESKTLINLFIYKLKSENSPMMIHFQYTSLAHTAMMRTIGFNATALWTLEDNFALAKTHLLDVFLGCVAQLHCSRITEHCLQMTGYCKEYSTVKNDHVNVSVYWIGIWK